MMSELPGRSLSGARVLELTQRYPPAIGGVERHVEQLVSGLARAGARVEVVTTDLLRDHPLTRARFPPGPSGTEVRRHRAVRWSDLPKGLGLAAPGMLGDALRARADLLHAHAFGYFPTWVGRIVRDLRRVPLVITPHSYEGRSGLLGRTYARAVTRATLERADRVVALTRLEADRLTRLGVEAERIRVIPNGIDLEEFAGLLPRVARERAPVLLYVGRIFPEQKGLDTLLEAFAEVARRTPARLRLVGDDWGALGALGRRARELGVADRVEATGALPREGVLREYGAADLFVLPSHFDSFPYVLLEAMAASLPVVSTRVGGIPEVVQEGRTALLVPPRDPTALADALVRLLTDPPLAQRFGAAGRSRVEQFSSRRLVAAYLDLFAELLGSNPR